MQSFSLATVNFVNFFYKKCFIVCKRVKIKPFYEKKAAGFHLRPLKKLFFFIHTFAFAKIEK